jgi:hypothetical protein
MISPSYVKVKNFSIGFPKFPQFFLELSQDCPEPADAFFFTAAAPQASCRFQKKLLNQGPSKQSHCAGFSMEENGSVSMENNRPRRGEKDVTGSAKL